MTSRVTGLRFNTAALLDSPELAAGMVAIAEPKLSAAQASAPVLSGAYRDGLHIEQREHGEVRITGSTDHDVYVEADTGNLARSLDA